MASSVASTSRVMLGPAFAGAAAAVPPSGARQVARRSLQTAAVGSRGRAAACCSLSKMAGCRSSSSRRGMASTAWQLAPRSVDQAGEAAGSSAGQEGGGARTSTSYASADTADRAPAVADEVAMDAGTLPEGVAGATAAATASAGPTNAAAEEAPEQQEKQVSDIESRRLRRTMLSRFQELGSTQNRNTTFRPHHARFDPKAAREITLSHLMAANAHVGHHKSQTLSAYHPLLLGTRNSISIIDIEQHTLPALKRVSAVVRKVLAADGIVLFVATGPGQQAAVLRACKRLGANGFHVTTERWIPGTLTNAPKLLAPAIYKSLEVAQTDVNAAPDTTKLASQTYQPDLVVVLNPRDNANALREATDKHIPTIAIVDSNVDPRIVTYAIPGNDDSLRFCDLVVGTIARAGEEGLKEGQRLRDEADRARRRQRRLQSSAGNAPQYSD